jgi:WD40 repeat protein
MNRYAASVLALCTAGVVMVWPSLAAGIDFGAQEFVQANGVDIQVPGYSVPSFEDWNNDGLRDLIIGEGGNSISGKVRIYLNVGTEVQPQFKDFFYAKSNGVDLVCTPSGCMGCFPRLVDWNQDGRKDLLVGQSDGTVRIFMNISGPNDLPTFDGGAKVTVGSSVVFDLDVGNRATPSLVDWNDDGLLDLVVGGLDGAIHIYLNCGCNGGVPPAFFTSTSLGLLAQENGHDLLVPGSRSSPIIMDFDGDGKKDILTGNTDGLLLFYKNVGLDVLPTFAGYSLVTSMGVPIQLTGSLRTRPSICHWTGDGRFGPKDGYWDLLVGYGDGKIRLYRGNPKACDFNSNGTLDADDFTILVKALDKPVPVGGSSCDLNQDGVVNDLDLRIFANLWLAEHEAEGN